MHPFLRDVKTFILDTLFPIQCLFCQTSDKIICGACIAGFKNAEHQLCIVCRKPSILGITHSACLTRNTAHGLLSLFDYHDEKVSQSIIYGKYKFVPDIYHVLGKTLGQWILEQKLHTYLQNFIIVPLPLAKPRQRWRGYNQAEILAQEVSTVLHLPVTNLLQRTRSTKTQKDLKKEARGINVSGAFAIAHVKNPWYFKFIVPTDKTASLSKVSATDKNIILIDDVITTGSTLTEAISVLRANGAKKILCLTLARD